MAWRQFLAAGFTVFTLFVLVMVVTSHQWIGIESSKQTYSSGIWKICTKMVCDSIHAKAVYFQIVRMMLVLALFCGFFCSSYMLFTYRYSPACKVTRFLVAAVGCFITSFWMIIANMVYTIFIVKRGIAENVRVTYLPTFYLAWYTAPAFAISGFLCLMAHYFMPVHRLSLTDQDSSHRSSSLELRFMSSESCHHELMASSIAGF